MTEPFNGLRFDIYERVNLPEESAAIGELEEIELVPSMQALNQQDHVLIKGHLLLSGVYRTAEEKRGLSRLEYRIPVEISLPQNRVARMEDLAVEIDNFDVDVLSARCLNVTGVLALRGLLAESQPFPVWRDDSFTVVHQAQTPSGSGPEPDERLAGAEPERAEASEAWASPAQPLADRESAFVDRASAFSSSAAPEGGWGAEHPQQPAPLSDEGPESADALDSGVDGAGDSAPSGFSHAFAGETSSSLRPEEWESDVGWGDISVRRDAGGPGLPEYPSETGALADGRLEEPPEAEPEAFYEVQSDAGADVSERQPDEGVKESAETAAAEPPEKPEMKVALGGKPLDAVERVPSGVGLLSMLGDKGAAREAGLQAMRSAQDAAEQEQQNAPRASTGDELEWTKLFLNKGAEAQPFSKVRMCIVQREETLDSIAARYNVQIRELQLRNRLTDHYVSEGQVLYIP